MKKRGKEKKCKEFKIFWTVISLIIILFVSLTFINYSLNLNFNSFKTKTGEIPSLKGGVGTLGTSVQIKFNSFNAPWDLKGSENCAKDPVLVASNLNPGDVLNVTNISGQLCQREYPRFTQCTSHPLPSSSKSYMQCDSPFYDSNNTSMHVSIGFYSDSGSTHTLISERALVDFQNSQIKIPNGANSAYAFFRENSSDNSPVYFDNNGAFNCSFYYQIVSGCNKKTCANYSGQCGNSLDDGCGGTIDCSNSCSGDIPKCNTNGVCVRCLTNPDCPSGLICNSTWQCQCNDTCSSLGYQCGTQTVCGSSTSCGQCSSQQICNSTGQCIGSSIDVQLIFPDDNFVTTNSYVDTIANFSSNVDLKNTTIYVWDSSNSLIINAGSIISGLSLLSYSVTIVLPYSGNFKWNFFTCNSLDNCTFSNINRTIVYQSTCPDSCNSKNYQCGNHMICGVNTNCGNCSNSQSCDANGICISGPDIYPPVISSVSISSITSDSVILNWNTDENSNTTINYGLNSLDLNIKRIDSNMLAEHSLKLFGLLSSTTYYYNLTSCDNSGNCATSGANSFTTNSIQGSVGAPKKCSENWVCGNWSQCISGEVSRVCVDKNKCNTNTSQPVLTLNCIDNKGNGDQVETSEKDQGIKLVYYLEASAVILIVIIIMLIIIRYIKNKNYKIKKKNLKAKKSGDDKSIPKVELIFSEKKHARKKKKVTTL